MLSFSPGELSTIEGRIAILGNGYSGWGSSLTKQFNFRDLPCPPQSIMVISHYGFKASLANVFQEANWYKPEPGEPYRPLIAMPSQLKQDIPWFSFCEDVFTAYDPPRALRSAVALAPVITPASDPHTQKLVAAPSQSVDPGARITAVSKVSMPVSMTTPVAQKVPSQPTDVDPESSSDHKQGTNIGQSGDVTGDPGNKADPNVPSMPLQSPAAVNSNQDPDQNSSPLEHNAPKPNGNDDPTGNDPEQKAAGASQTMNPETTTLAGPSKDANSADKAPHQVPQRILTTIAGHGITAAPSSVAIAGATINPGDPATILGGTRIALNTAGSLIVGSKTIPLASRLPGKLTTNIAGLAITAHPTGVTVAGSTMSPGDPATLIGGTKVALNTAGSLILGAMTIPLASGLSEPLTTTIANQPLTANPTALIVAGTTMNPGDPTITVEGTPIALDAAGNLVIASKTIPFETGTKKVEPLVTTIAGQVITAAAGGIALAGTTLKKGDAGYSINGTVISLDSAGRFVVGFQTQSFENESVGSGTGFLAGTTTPLVVQGDDHSNGTGSAATTTGVQKFTGEAGGWKGDFLAIKAGLVVIAGFVLRVSLT